MTGSKLIRRCSQFLLLLVGLSLLSGMQKPPTAQSKPADDVPVMDGEIGPCSVEFTVTDAEGKPILNALINVHIAYGFAGVRKLDAGVYTNLKAKESLSGFRLRSTNPLWSFAPQKTICLGLPRLIQPASARRSIAL